MSSTFVVTRLEDGRGTVCRALLSELPEWFGISEAIDAYARAADAEDTLVCTAGGANVGIAVLRTTSAYVADLHLIAVRRAFQRRGVGRLLVEAAETWARRAGCRFLTVKTLGPSRPNAAYAETRRFYEVLGLVPLEELDGVWPGNPCLFMLKPLAP